MKSSEGQVGRVFVIRLEDGDVLPGCIERFAEENGVSVGHAILVGGIGGGEVVVGPRRSDEMPPEPMLLPIDGAHEVAGVGVLAPGGDGKPVLHIHAARSSSTRSPARRRRASRTKKPASSCWSRGNDALTINIAHSNS